MNCITPSTTTKKKFQPLHQFLPLIWKKNISELKTEEINRVLLTENWYTNHLSSLFTFCGNAGMFNNIIVV